jgi:CheY-like chemotaxis protein
MNLRKKLKCILLVDDDPDDNIFHQIVIQEMDVTDKIDVVGNGLEALAYLKREGQVPPELIFLDINMPKMNGWEFLLHYKELAPNLKARVVIMILTTSANPDDIKKAKEIQQVTGFETKPLCTESLTEILKQHFQDYI